MNQYMETFHKYLAELEKGEGELEGQSLLEILYYCFCVHNDLNTREISQTLLEMDGILKNLSMDDQNRICDITCDLCQQYQREAFRTGLLIGFRLHRELTGKQ